MELSTLLASVSSANQISNMFLSQDRTALEKLVQQLIPRQTEALEDYTSQIFELSKQTGLDITKIAQPLAQDPYTLNRPKQTTDQPSSTVIPEFNVSEFQKSLNEDRQKAKKMIDELVAMARATKLEFMKEYMDKPIHPYERMIQDYLGKDFKPKTIEEMPIEPDIDPLKVIAHITALSKDLQEKSMKQARMIVEQALDTSFPGITSEALGTAFAVLSGDEFVIDHEMTARHLEFCENLRNVSVEYVVNHPYEAAKRILSEFMRVGYAF